MAERPLALEPLARITLNELAYSRLKHALLSGRLEPGTALTLRELAAQLGTSMMPVREAVTRLSAENALVVLPNRGIKVPTLDAATAAELWRLRELLEGEACAEAARHVTAAELARIRTLRDAVEAHGRAGALHGVLEANSAFQFAIYEAARGPIALQLIEVLRMKSVPHCTTAIRRMLRDRPAYFDECWANHDALVDALARGDAEAARAVKLRDLRGLRALVAAAEGAQA
ncbi:MAG TPA: GntR family transcriptional regulator [Gammaproteobacteria bacterium]|nr:GntR family transcriptional regulator [Gammaproteobacteria bacterium]